MAINVNTAPGIDDDSPQVVPVFNDLSQSATSTQSSRRNYRMKVDVIVSDGVISDINAGTLNVYPDSAGNCIYDVHRILESYINYDASFYLINAAQRDINTLNHYYLNLSEEYSNIIDLTSVANDSGNLRLNFAQTHNLVVNDRVYLNIGNNSINPQYNTYAKVINVNTTTSVTVDIPYVSTSIISSPIAYEGVEFFDSSFGVNGNVLVTTTTPHNLNVGDQIVLQMDNWAVGIVRLNSGASGSVDSITVNGVNIMSAPVAYNTSLENTAALVVANINAHTSSPDYTAYALAGDPRIFIYSKRDVNAANFPIVVTTTTIVAAYKNTMTQGISGDIISNTGPIVTLNGWNPQYSGVWKVLSTPTPTTFQTEIPFGTSTVTGSERGTVYSLDNFKSDTLTRWPAGTEKIGFLGMVNDSYTNWSEFYRSDLIVKAPNNGDSTYIDKEFLTDGPIERDISIDDFEFLTILNTPAQNGTLIANRYIIEQINNLGAVTSTSVQNISLTPTTYANRLIHIPIGPKNLASIFPIVESRYRVSLANVTGPTTTRMSKYYYYNVKCYNRNLHELSQQPYTRLMWVNSWGGWDFYNFTGTCTPSLEVERFNYEQKKGFINSTGNQYNINSMQKGGVIFNVDANDTYRLVSDFMNVPTYDWVKKLLVSPDVRVQYLTGTGTTTRYLPIYLTDKNYDFAGRHDKLKQFIINIQPAHTRSRQRGSGDPRNNTSGIIT